jgi:hypothetical protein
MAAYSCRRLAGTMLLTPALNEMIDITATRVMATPRILLHHLRPA